MQFDKDFEEDILARALRDKGYLRKAVRILDAHHFNSPQHSWVWSCIRKTWMSYRELVSPKLMMERAKTDYQKDDDRLPYLELTSKLYRRKPASSAAALNELGVFVKTVSAQLAMEKAASALEKGDVEKTYAALRDLVRRDVTQRDYTIVNWSEDFPDRQRERKLRHDHPELYTVIPTGWKRLDRVIDGLELGELGLVMATTGKGKSIALNNFAHTAVTRGFETVYFSLEMPARQVAMRQDARWLGYSYGKFKHYSWKPSELRAVDVRFEKMKNKFLNKLKIISLPLRRGTIDVIHSALEDLEQEHNFRPKLILLDSGDHLKSSTKMESYRLSQAENYWGLKNLAEEGGYAIWSSVQAGREWAKLIAQAEAASESYDKARIADVVLSINSPEEETRSTKIALDANGEERNRRSRSITVVPDAELYIAKYRDGVSRVKIPLRCDFDKMTIEEIEEEEQEERQK